MPEEPQHRGMLQVMLLLSAHHAACDTSLQQVGVQEGLLQMPIK